jgi:hypothetical protein
VGDLFIDAVYEGMRQWGCSRGILCAWGTSWDGSKVLLHLALGIWESYQNCLDFIRDIVRRGLQAPVPITTGGTPGVIRAVSDVWELSLPLHPGQENSATLLAVHVAAFTGNPGLDRRLDLGSIQRGAAGVAEAGSGLSTACTALAVIGVSGNVFQSNQTVSILYLVQTIPYLVQVCIIGLIEISTPCPRDKICEL